MSEYTPTRQELIAAWIIAHQEEGWGGQVDMGGSPKERIAEAHRGIAEVERASAEKALREFATHLAANVMPETGPHINMTQYREGLVDGVNRAVIAAERRALGSVPSTGEGNES